MFEADANIVGARLLVGNDLIEGGISIEEGKITKIGKTSSLPRAQQNYNAKGLVAIPGLIDTHVHLRDLQLAYKEDFYTGTCAAAAGGFTTVLDMPNNVPPTNSAANLRLRRDAAIGKIVTNLGFHAGLVGDPTELEKMRDMGAYSFKLYLNDAQAAIDTNSDPAITDAFSTCALLKIPISVHAEDRATIEERMSKFKGKPLRLEDYSYVHGPDAEFKGVKRILEITGKSGATVHLCHMSLASSIDVIKGARSVHMQVSCEATPHHLLLSKKNQDELKGWALSDPPLRDLQEVRNLWKEFLSLEFTTIASDHAPHSLAEKSSPDAREIKPGMPGLETTLPLLLTKVSQGELSLSKVVELLAHRPAKIFGLQGKMGLTEGADADITLIDLEKEYVIDPEKFHSKARYSPFAGYRCKGQVSKVIVGGQMVFENGEIVAPPGVGQVLERAPG